MRVPSNITRTHASIVFMARFCLSCRRHLVPKMAARGVYIVAVS